MKGEHQQQGQAHFQNRADHPELQREPKSVPQIRVADGRGIVGQSDERRAGEIVDRDVVRAVVLAEPGAEQMQGRSYPLAAVLQRLAVEPVRHRLE